MYDFLLAGSALLFAFVAFGYARHPAASFFHPATIYLAFHGLVFVIRPIFARIFDYSALYRAAAFFPSDGDKVTVILAANLGMLTFLATSLAIARYPVATGPAEIDEAERARLVKPFLLVFLLVLPIGLASLFQNWAVVADGWSAMQIDMATGVQHNETMNGWFFTALLALVPCVVAFAWFFRFRWWSLLPFVVYFVLLAGTGGRGPFVVAAVAIVILYLFQRGRQWPDWRGMVIALIVIVAFTQIVVDRGQGVRALFTQEVGETPGYQAPPGPLASMDYANMEFFEYIVWAVPKQTGTYDYFLSNLQIFTEPIPRVWWTSKPLGAPIKRFNLFDYGEPFGFTYSVPGAGWLAWGWIGVVIQSAIFAAAFSWLHRRLALKSRSNIYLLFYAVTIASTIIAFRDGIILSAIRTLPFYGGPVLLLWLFHRALERRPQPWDRAPAHAHGPQPRLTPAERRRLLAATL